MTCPDCHLYCARWVEETLFRTTLPPEEVAAIFVEPIQGEGGYIIPPPEFHQVLNDIAKKYGILYVADEVQSGMGRTGKMFAMEHFKIVPGMMALAKGIASGMPIGALVASHDIMDWEAGSHASTFGGIPLSCQAAMATIELLENSLMENAQRQDRRLMDGLKTLQENHECISDVRGKGLMVAAEFVEDRETKTPARKLRGKIIDRAFQKGLLLLGCGENSIRFCPALTVTGTQIDLCLSIFEDAITEAVG